MSQLVNLFGKKQQEDYNNVLNTESPRNMSILFRTLTQNIQGASPYAWVLPELSRAIELRQITVHNLTQPVKIPFEQLKRDMPRLLPGVQDLSKRPEDVRDSGKDSHREGVNSIRPFTPGFGGGSGGRGGGGGGGRGGGGRGRGRRGGAVGGGGGIEGRDID